MPVKLPKKNRNIRSKFGLDTLKTNLNPNQSAKSMTITFNTDMSQNLTHIFQNKNNQKTIPIQIKTPQNRYWCGKFSNQITFKLNKANIILFLSSLFSFVNFHWERYVFWVKLRAWFLFFNLAIEWVKTKFPMNFAIIFEIGRIEYFFWKLFSFLLMTW